MSVLSSHDAAIGRTLEQKIADAGPGPLRVNPHILTPARRELEEEGRVLRLTKAGVPWYYLANSHPDVITRRIAEQDAVHSAMMQHDVIMRIGQAAEIAVYRAVRSQVGGLPTFGAFPDLDEHGDERLYTKEEPPSTISGRTIPGRRKLDFIAVHPQAGAAGIEVKNIREWLYPDRSEVRELLLKCCSIDAVPVLIGRRVAYVTHAVLWQCGVVIHEFFNQRFAEIDRVIALQAAHKTLLGYHDIRIGNQPDARLETFICRNLPRILPEARRRFDKYKDLLINFATGETAYAEFAARVRRRTAGVNEDNDWPEPKQENPYEPDTDGDIDESDFE